VVVAAVVVVGSWWGRGFGASWGCCTVRCDVVARPVVLQAIMDPTGRVVATTDNFGRVMLLDSHDMQVTYGDVPVSSSSSSSLSAPRVTRSR
jgi:hypothetical protein